MKAPKLMRGHGVGVAALIVTVTMLGTATLLAKDAPTNPPDSKPKAETAAPAAVDSNVMLSAPTREVVKLVMSGVGEDVQKAYVYHSPSGFNLTADSIIHLKAVGVSSDVLAAMLNRDTMLRDQAALNARGLSQAQIQTTPPSQPPPSNEYTTAPPDYGAQASPPSTTYYSYPDDYYYDYGYPYAGYYYPWGFYGGWCFVGGRWSWFPQRGFAGRGFAGRGFIGAPFRGGIGGFPFLGGRAFIGGGSRFGGGGRSSGGHGGGGGGHR